MDNPQTLDEWDVYFSRYTGEQLLSKLKVMNKQSFCKRMRAKGYELLEIKELLLMAARRVASAGYIPPKGVYNLNELVQGDVQAERGYYPEGSGYDDRISMEVLDQDNTLRFWKATAYDEAGHKKVMTLQGSYEKERIIEILTEVHPELNKLELEEIERPKWLKSTWGEDLAA